jgi:phosphatidylinositol 4-phosphatase
MPIKLQGGVIRTNCLDNLDRTNIVQSSLAKRVLAQQLQALGFIGLNESVDDFEELSQVFRNRAFDTNVYPRSAG